MSASHVDLLIELGVEEIPAAVAPAMLRALGDALVALLAEADLAHGKVTELGTPRRLTVHIADVVACQEDRELEVLGPPARVAFAADGTPTRAADGFLRAQGAEASALLRVVTDKGEYAALRRFVAGRPLAALVGEALSALIAGLPSPKRMRWGREREAFIRPLQWIVALAGTTPIDCRFADVHSGRTSRGHRFYGEIDAGVGAIPFAPADFEGAAVVLDSADLDAYRAKLRQAFVDVDPAGRRATIHAGVTAVADAAGGTLVQDEATLDVVTWLVEWPSPLLGVIDAALLRIPDAVTQTTLRENQKLFTIRGSDARLLPHFIAVANTLRPGREAVIAAGNARVVSARMADAAFFYDADRSRPLSDFVPRLSGRTWLEGMGSTLDKVTRVQALTSQLADALAPDAKSSALRAAGLCKADLATQMVFEFPELQGVIGEDYALAAGEDAAVAAAIREHYLPRGAADDLPTGDAGALVGLADRLDSIAATFGLGLIPSGSNDPYALRRAALGVLRVLHGKGWSADLAALVATAVSGVPSAALVKPVDALVADVLDFFRARLRAWLSDADAEAGGHAVDTVEAVLDAGFRDIPAVFERAAALTAFRAGADFAALAAGFKRVGNLAKKANADDLSAIIDRSRFEKPAEAAMADAVDGLAIAVGAAVSERRWDEALGLLASLRPHVDAFFDEVMVMADDPAVRRNRLALLGRTAELFSAIADFGRVQQS